MVQAMGEGLNLQTGLPGDFSDAEEEGFSSDSDYHEQLLFDEEPIKVHPISSGEINPGRTSSGLLYALAHDCRSLSACYPHWHFTRTIYPGGHG